MYNKVKTTVVKHWKTTTVVTKNVLEFADAAALAAVSGFAIYSSYNKQSYWYKALLLAGVLISLQAFVLLVRTFNKAPVKK
jgi:hypothetical protein